MLCNSDRRDFIGEKLSSGGQCHPRPPQEGEGTATSHEENDDSHY
jgi:hypothetical protein